MRTKTKKKGGKRSGAASRSRKGSVCDLCAHDDETPCGASCTRGLENPLVTNAFSFERRRPHVTAFYCACAQLYGELHQLTLLPATESFQEQRVVEVGSTVLARFEQFWDESTPSNSKLDDEEEAVMTLPPLCPFVMMLSIVMPSLRKLIAWIAQTKSVWSGAAGTVGAPSASGSSTSSSRAAASSQAARPATNAFLTLIALHDVVTNVTVECEKLSRLIELNEGADEEPVYVRPKPTAAVGAVPARSGTPPPAELRAGPSSTRIPQVKKISLEFDEVFAETKCVLAELTESILEATETVRAVVCRALSLPMSDKMGWLLCSFIRALVASAVPSCRKTPLSRGDPSYVCVSYGSSGLVVTG